MLAALLLNFGLLAALKYTDDVRGWFGASPLGLLLPLGISFYTFQSMGYLLDVYNGKYAPQKNLARFALFVSFFPQLIQGPIGRYDQLEKQLESGGHVNGAARVFADVVGVIQKDGCRRSRFGGGLRCV